MKLNKNNPLRAETFTNFKGKKEIVKNLKIYIDAAIENNHSLDHVLLCGLPGTGKTSLAHIIANQFHSNIKIIQGSSLQKPSDIINVALSLNKGDFLFIDEIHTIDKKIVELLYSIMEDFAIDITIGKEFNSKITRINTPPFTLIGATTNVGKIMQPLENRFPIKIMIDEYSVSELSEIIFQNSKKLNLSLNEGEIKLIAQNAKGIPRIANNILKRISDFQTFNKNLNVKTILKRIGILHEGIDSDDLKYLKILSKHSDPIGIKTLSQIIGYDYSWIELKIEPYLLKCGFILKTNKGRILTTTGKKIVHDLT